MESAGVQPSGYMYPELIETSSLPKQLRTVLKNRDAWVQSRDQQALV